MFLSLSLPPIILTSAGTLSCSCIVFTLLYERMRSSITFNVERKTSVLDSNGVSPGLVKLVKRQHAISPRHVCTRIYDYVHVRSP